MIYLPNGLANRIYRALRYIYGREGCFCGLLKSTDLTRLHPAIK